MPLVHVSAVAFGPQNASYQASGVSLTVTVGASAMSNGSRRMRYSLKSQRTQSNAAGQSSRGPRIA